MPQSVSLDRWRLWNVTARPLSSPLLSSLKNNSSKNTSSINRCQFWKCFRTLTWSPQQKILIFLKIDKMRQSLMNFWGNFKIVWPPDSLESCRFGPRASETAPVSYPDFLPDSENRQNALKYSKEIKKTIIFILSSPHLTSPLLSSPLLSSPLDSTNSPHLSSQLYFDLIQHFPATSYQLPTSY